jgi:hypothetical protein
VDELDRFIASIQQIDAKATRGKNIENNVWKVIVLIRLQEPNILAARFFTVLWTPVLRTIPEPKQPRRPTNKTCFSEMKHNNEEVSFFNLLHSVYVLIVWKTFCSQKIRMNDNINLSVKDVKQPYLSIDHYCPWVNRQEQNWHVAMSVKTTIGFLQIILIL